jgi:acyl-CoA synthetase (AMP-forming)/AMP-acid ligase II
MKGNLWFVSRKKHLIIRGGSNISPVEVEQVLITHPAVRDAAVVGVPDAELGQRVAGFVQSATSAHSVSLNEICVLTLLANIYLDYVYGLWVDRWQKRHAQGQIIIGCFADDIVMGFEHKGEAGRFVADMRQRMEKLASKSCSRSATAWSV